MRIIAMPRRLSLHYTPSSRGVNRLAMCGSFSCRKYHLLTRAFLSRRSSRVSPYLSDGRAS